MPNSWWTWAKSLFLAPGDALIAAAGPTPLGATLGLSPAMAGSGASALLSLAGWLLALGLAYWAVCFFQDVVDPTWRQQRRERRMAEARRRRAYSSRR